MKQIRRDEDMPPGTNIGINFLPNAKSFIRALSSERNMVNGNGFLGIHQKGGSATPPCHFLIYQVLFQYTLIGRGDR
jgi:hypothetical protein